METVNSEPHRPAPRLRHLVVKAGAWVVSGFVLDKALALAQIMVVARLLAPADVGLMAMSAAVLLVLFTLSEMGVEQALVARREIHDDDLAVAWTIAILRGAVLACGLWLAADLIAHLLQAPALSLVLRAHALGLLLQGMQSPAMALLQRQLDLKQRVRMDLIRRVGETTVTIALALWWRSVWALVIGQLVGFSLGCLLSYVAAPFRPRFTLRGPSLRYFLSFGKRVNPTTVLTVLVMSGGEFVVGRLLGMGSLGLYQIALSIPLLIGVRATVMIGQVSLPTYSRLQTDRSGVIKAFVIQMKLVGLLLFPATMILAVFAPVLVPLLFGPRWLDAVEPLRVLCVYAMCAGLTGTLASVQYGLNRPEYPMRVAMAQVLVYAMAIGPLTVWFGLTGAAGSLVAAYGAGMILSARYTVQLLGQETRPVFASLLGIVLLSGGIGLVTMQVLPSHQAVGSRLLVMAAGISLFYILYVWRVEYPKLRSLWRGEAC